MKANAPEKIYVSIHSGIHHYEQKNDDDIEYIRTDVFIEKACSSIEKLLSGYIIRNFHFGDSYDIDRLIEDFEEYLKK